MNFRTLALKNVRGNGHRYMAYYLSSAFTVMIFFIYAAFIFHPDVVSGMVGDKIRKGLMFCEYIIIVFSFFFVLYSNSAFLKTRQKEFGLLALFGMTRTQIKKIILYENTAISLVSIGTGILFGVLLSKLFFMAIGVLLDLANPIPFMIAPQAVWITFVCFFALFESLTVLALLKLGRREIIDLLKAAHKPKPYPVFSKWLGLLSVLCLGGGYYLAWHTATQINVGRILLLVVVGTYFLFTQGSVMLVRFLQKSRRFYYRRTHLLTVSQLAYRLKDNARTLFNVAILSAVVLTATGTFYTLYQGLLDRNLMLYPHAVSFVERGDNEQGTGSQVAEHVLEEQGLRIIEKDVMTGFVVSVAKVDGDEVADSLFVMANRDYNSRAEKMDDVDPFDVGRGQAVVVTPYPELEAQSDTDPIDVTVEAGDKNVGFTVNEQRHIPIVNQRHSALIPSETNAYILVVNDKDYATLLENVPDSEKLVYFGYELKNWEQSEEAMQAMKSQMPDALEGSFSSRVEPYVSDKQTWGLVLFIGLFVSILFFMAAGSFLYFKMFTELHEDKAQFKALRRIGLTEHEMRKVTTVQIGAMFLLPFLVGVIHAAFALKVLANILAMSVWYYGLVVAIVYFLAQLVYFWLSRQVYLRQITQF